MLTQILLVAVALAALANLIFLWFLYKKNTGGPKADDVGLKLLLTQINELNRTVDGKMSDLSRVMDSKISESSRLMSDSLHRQFSESSKLIKDVTQGLTKLDETNKQVVSFTDQLQSLQDILKNPKQRGVLGEYYLETLLKNVLPPGSFQMQYPFQDGINC
jgi:DNA recombination protein RmuC